MKEEAAPFLIYFAFSSPLSSPRRRFSPPFFFFFFCFLFPTVTGVCQAERYQLVLGTGKQEPEPKLLVLMMVQKDKYEKWLFRVLMVLTELMVRGEDKRTPETGGRN